MKFSKIFHLFWEVGNIILGAGGENSAHRKREGAKKSPQKNKQVVPERIRGFFEKRHAGWPEYVMLKAQIAILLLFFTNVVYLVLSPGENLIFLFLFSICSGYLVYQMKTQFKPAFKEDYPAYRSFAVICIIINWALMLLLRFLPAAFPVEYNLNIVMPTFLTIAIIIGAFATFRIKYGRNFCYGLVKESHGDYALVRVGYDIRSNVKAGVYLVKSPIRVKKGDVVKLALTRPLLGLEGSRVKAVAEIVVWPTPS